MLRLKQDLEIPEETRNWVQTQWTDASHVVAKIRSMNRLEMVGETVRRALNDLAQVAPAWLSEHIQLEWLERYGRPFENSRLPESESEQEALAQVVGQDGYHLLHAALDRQAPAEVQGLTSIEIMRRIWVQQYYLVDGETHWRTKAKWGLPPAGQMITSLDELDPRYDDKGCTYWTEYKMRSTEICSYD